MKWIVFLTLATTCQTGFAQERSAPAEFVDSYNERILTQPPLVGSTLVDVTAWDADGKPFELGSTRGKHTVIVFGCLT